MKPERKRPEVEELSDLQWARIERGLWHRLDAEADGEATAEADRAAARRDRREDGPAPRWRRRWLAIGGGLAMAAALLLVLLLGGRGPGTTPARVMTSESATTVSFAEAAIQVAPRSSLLMSGSAERGATIVLELGRASFQVAPRRQDAPFVVKAGLVTVRVVGTRFEVMRRGAEVRVEVTRGQVEVQYLGEVHRVLSGEHWSSPSLATRQVLLDAGAAAADGEAEAAAAAAGEADGGADGEAGAEAAAGGEEDAGPTAAAASADGEATPSRRRPARRDAPAIDAAPGPARPAIAPTSPAPMSAEASALAAEFAAAARLESAAPQQALRRYLALAQREDRWGSNALFAAARLALDVGEPARAATLARAYLRRFPRGLNAADARALLDALP